MKHTQPPLVSRLFVCWIAALLLCLVGCNRNDDQNNGAGHSFAYTLVGNPDTLDPQLAQNASAKMVLGNLFEGLFTLDANGSVKPNLVKAYTVSEDKCTYTITLRDDSYWYDAMHEDSPFSRDAAQTVTAEDFVYAFRRLFDPLYNSPYRKNFLCLENAQKILAGKEDPSMIGVYAKKQYELVFCLDTPNADFLSLLTMTAALPCNESYFESTKGRYGLDENSIIGNGGFAMQRWLYDPYGKYNVIQLRRNPLVHEAARVSPVDLTFYIEENESDAEALFSAGSTDCCVTTRNALLSRSDISSQSAYSMTLGIFAAPESPYANRKILAALNAAVDRTNLSLETDDVRMASGILAPAVTLLNKSCRELIAESGYASFDIKRAEDLLAEGLFELQQQDLPEGRILVPAGMMDYTPLQTVLVSWQANLNLHMRIEEVAQHEYRSRLENGDYVLALLPISGDSYDAAAFFEALLANDQLHCSNASTVQSLLADAAAAENLTACVELYHQAEASILEDSCFIPLFYKQRYLLCHKNVEDVAFNPFSGQLYFRDAKYFN